MDRPYTQEEAEAKTITYCAKRHITLLGKYAGMHTVTEFFQEGYGLFCNTPHNVWHNKSNHPTKIKENKMNSCLEKYGTRNNFLATNANGTLKRVTTNIKKFGGINNSCNKTCLKAMQDKQQKTMLARYGVKFAAQNPMLFDKIMAHQRRSHIFSCSIGDIVYQSTYELAFLKISVKDPNVCKITRDPRIEYVHPLDNKPHHYYIDFVLFYKSGSKEYIEIKSKYYFGDDTSIQQHNKKLINTAKNTATEEFALKQGGLFKCLIS